jgi:hypothetical protein
MAAIPPGIPPAVCPYPKAAAAPAEAPTVHTAIGEKLGDARAETIGCPYLRTGVMEDYLHPDANGEVSFKELNGLFKATGISLPLRFVAIQAVKKIAAEMAGVHGFVATMSMKSINLYKLRESSLMHTGDSKILRDGLNQGNLDRLLGYAQPGSDRVTTADLAAANKNQVAAEPGEHGHVFGITEYSIILKTFGEKGEHGEKFLSKKDLTTIFKDNRFPDGWEKRKVGIVGLGLMVALMFDHQKHDPARPVPTVGGTVDGASPAGSASGTAPAKGVCPFLNGKPFTAEEAAQQHKDMLPPE